MPYLAKMRWLPTLNVAGEDIPPFAAMEKDGKETDGSVRVKKPTADSLLPEKVMFNGPATLFSGGRGMGTQDYAIQITAFVTGSPSAKTSVGTVSGQWYLAEGKSHFQTWSAVSNGVALVVPCVDRAGRGGCSSGSRSLCSFCPTIDLEDWTIELPTITVTSQIVGFSIAGCDRGGIVSGVDGGEEVTTETTAGEDFFCDPPNTFPCATSQRIADPSVGGTLTLVTFLSGIWAASTATSAVAVTRTIYIYSDECGTIPSDEVDDEFGIGANVFVYCERQTANGFTYDAKVVVTTVAITINSTMDACCEAETGHTSYGAEAYYRLDNPANCEGPLTYTRIGQGPIVNTPEMDVTFPDTLTVTPPP